MMQREYTWEVTIDGAMRRIYCRFEGNRYVLYADEDHVANIYRKSVHTMWQGMEESVNICGKECLFVVWDERPDIVVDGRLVGRGIDYQKALKKKNAGFLTGYRIVFWAGVGLLAVMAVLICAGWGSAADWDDVIISIIAGVWMVIWGARNMRRLTPAKNGSIIGEDKSKGANR